MSAAKDAAAGLVIGALTGIAASFAMNRFQQAWAALSRDDEGSGDTSGSSTVKAANEVSKAVVGKPIAPDKKPQAGNLVHYATGAGLGAFYGAAVVLLPRWGRGARMGVGAAFGAWVWLVLDEGIVPLLRLGAPPEKTAPSDHAYALVSHLVFGIALEGSRQVLDLGVHSRGQALR